MLTVSDKIWITQQIAEFLLQLDGEAHDGNAIENVSAKLEYLIINKAK